MKTFLLTISEPVLVADVFQKKKTTAATNKQKSETPDGRSKLRALRK